jgi:uncharacterized repeat protein (TIGR01451 family)
MMTDRKQILVRLWPALAVVLLALLVVPGSAAVPDQPPSVSYPEIHKHSDEDAIGLGDHVQFTVTVRNDSEPPPPLDTWYNVRATDVLSPSLAIDTVDYSGDHSYSVVGNTVIVTATTLAPNEIFTFDIHCTVVSIPEPEPVITNTALLQYEDETGEPAVSVTSEPVVITVLRRTFLPTILRNY